MQQPVRWTAGVNLAENLHWPCLALKFKCKFTPVPKVKVNRVLPGCGFFWYVAGVANGDLVTPKISEHGARRKWLQPGCNEEPIS